MKKLFGIALLSVFVLAACGGSDDNGNVDGTVVCTDEEETMMTFYSEDGVITSVILEGTEDISSLSEVEVDLAIAFFEGLGGTYELDGDHLTLRLELEADQAITILELPSTDLDQVVADAEAGGATCN